MKNDIIQNLLNALAISPENIPLRMHVAGLLLQDGLFTDAGDQYQQVPVIKTFPVFFIKDIKQDADGRCEYRYMALGAKA